MCLMLLSCKNVAKAEDVNCGPLSVVIAQGFPSRAKTADRNAVTVSVVAAEVKATFGHLLK